MQKVKTICPYCGTGCGMFVEVQDGRITGVSGDHEHPVNEGGLCLKGMYGFQHVGDSSRLKSPMIRKNGELTAVGWDEALDYTADRLNAIKAKHGPDSIVLFSSARATNEDNFAAQKFMRAVVGTNNIDHCARL
jgi:formate dehydrogenase major subunit